MFLLQYYYVIIMLLLFFPKKISRHRGARKHTQLVGYSSGNRASDEKNDMRERIGL